MYTKPIHTRIFMITQDKFTYSHTHIHLTVESVSVLFTVLPPDRNLQMLKIFHPQKRRNWCVLGRLRPSQLVRKMKVYGVAAANSVCLARQGGEIIHKGAPRQDHWQKLKEKILILLQGKIISYQYVFNQNHPLGMVLLFPSLLLWTNSKVLWPANVV